MFKEKEVWSKRLLLILSLLISLKPAVLKSYPTLFAKLMQIAGLTLKRSAEIENYPELKPILLEIKQHLSHYF